MMKSIPLMVLATFFAWMAGSTVLAGDVEFVSTGEGDISGGDVESVDDPYKGKELKQRDLEGDPATQKSYGEECQDDLCNRAEKRQTSEGTTWRDDVDSGLKPTGY